VPRVSNVSDDLFEINIEIKNKEGMTVEAQAPVIISASRATDIPAFYSDWLIERLKAGYVKWKNPFNSKYLYVSFEKVRLFVFWSKNPKPLIKHLNYFNDNKLNYYFQFTLNNYDSEHLEPNVPDVSERIETFIELSELIGKDKVIWRFDPLILTDKIGIEELLKKTEFIGNQIMNHTEKMVFSFADIKSYKKVQNNLLKSLIRYQDFDDLKMIEFAQNLEQLNRKWNFEVGTCAEQISLEKYGIIHNKCIDDDLIIRLFSNDKVLMKFLGVEINEPSMFANKSIIKKKPSKDSGQRSLCGCVPSKDIGEYNTCPHLCEYCYANSSKSIAINNWNLYKQKQNLETITGL